MAQHNQTQAEWEQTMARRAMDLTRSELYVSLRYLTSALGALSPTPAPDLGLAGLATDGARLCYPPAWVLEIYRKNRRYLPRAYLHSVLHCLLRHPWLRGKRDPALWGLACDIAAESVLDSLQVPTLARPVGWLRQQTYAALKAKCKLLAAGPVYRALQEAKPEELQRLQREFYCDSHRLWPADPEDPQAQMMGRQWEQRGRETQVRMEQEAGRQAGASPGSEVLQAQVQAAHSRRLYRDFLRRFAVLREEPRLDPEEFDLGTYTYGLRTYGNLPLIEPLESRESKKIRDFVIVLDTSESTAGGLVKAFLKETFGLLKTADTFFHHCNIVVLQADDAVQDVSVLTDLDALDRYAASLHLKGGGGTDFRPAFAHIEQLCRDGVLRDLQGVLYFTDGKGIYPHKRPPFEVAFLFLEDGAPPPEVPPWAMKLVLSPEEFEPDDGKKPAPPAFDLTEHDPDDLPNL